MSPRELQGKFSIALEKIGGQDGAADARRHQPIYQREPLNTQKQAIDDAAKALSALWKLRTSHS